MFANIVNLESLYNSLDELNNKYYELKKDGDKESIDFNNELYRTSYEDIKNNLSFFKESINSLMPKFLKSMKVCPPTYRINNGICELDDIVKEKESKILLEATKIMDEIDQEGSQEKEKPDVFEVTPK